MVKAFIEFASCAVPHIATPADVAFLHPTAFLVQCMYFGCNWKAHSFVLQACKTYECTVSANGNLVQLVQDLVKTYTPDAPSDYQGVRAYLLYAAANSHLGIRLLESKESNDMLFMYNGQPRHDLEVAVYDKTRSASKNSSNDLRWDQLQDRLRHIEHQI